MDETPTTAPLLRAKWFNGRSSRPREVLIALEAGQRGPALRMHVLDLGHAGSRRFEHAEIGWPPFWSDARAPAQITVALHDHGSLVIDQPEDWKQALARAGGRPGLAQRMQTRWPVLLAVLGIAALGLVAFYRYGTPWAATQLARHVPLGWELGVSEQALAQIDRGWLKPSRLDSARQAELHAQFKALIAGLPPQLKRYPGYAPHYALQFRRGMGANAFALPGGMIVMTDGLVELAARKGLPDDALMGVLAHEIGHVEHRHGTRLMVEQGVLNIGLGLALGDVSAMVSMTSTLLTGLAYQRQHESESDCFAIGLMGASRRPTAPMAELLLQLELPEDRTSGGEPDGAAGSPSPMSDWLSSHPATSQRAERLRAGTDPHCAS